MAWFSKKTTISEDAEEEVVEAMRDLRSEDIKPTASGVAEDQEYPEGEWMEDAYDGQLAVDVYEQDDSIMLVSAIAGVATEDIDVTINRDVITIKGIRRFPEDVDEDTAILQECHWGGFSRTVILPFELREETAKATIRDGILTVRVEKTGEAKARTIPIEEVDE